MEKEPTTVGNRRITKQGVRDLNYYGPRAGKGVAGATVAEEKVAPAAPPPVTAAIEAHDKDPTK